MNHRWEGIAIGIYLNPGKEAFRRIRNGIYVDKSDLIDYINKTFFTTSNLTCFSRPRRFGKSFAAKMICAYYDKDADTAIKQIKEKRYDGKLKEYFGNLVMAGINYDKGKTKKHTCIIERV